MQTKIAVLVDLELSNKAGGHVKYWQRISEVFIQEKIDCELTIFFLGKNSQKKKISGKLFYKIQKPIFSSKYLSFLGIDADKTDLFPINPMLLFELKKYNLIHTTDQFFSMANTGLLASRLWKIPITTSIHTDTPPYTRYYVNKVLESIFFRFFGISKFLKNKLKIPNFLEQRMYKKMHNYIKKVNHAMVADQIYSPNKLIYFTKNQNITKLNRGVVKKIFYKKKVSISKIKKKYLIPQTDKILFFSGRVHQLKGAVLLAEIHKNLLSMGFNVTTIMAGEDIHGELCRNIAPKKLHLVGYLPQKEIASLYSICDLFVFPSQFEIGPNVVLEAKACGAVCLVSPGGGGKRINKDGEDGIIINDFDSKVWTKKIVYLFKKVRHIKEIKKNLNNVYIKNWHEVFLNDIYTYWKKNLKR